MMFVVLGLAALIALEKPEVALFRLSATPIEAGGHLRSVRARLTNISKKSLWVFEPDVLTTTMFLRDDKPENWIPEGVCAMMFEGVNPTLRRIAPGKSLSFDVVLWTNLRPGHYDLGVRYTESYAKTVHLAPHPAIRAQLKREIRSATFPVEFTDSGNYELRKS